MDDDADLEPGEPGDAAAFSYTEQSIRKAFVRKVYAIVMLQLVITLTAIFLFVYEPNINSYFLFGLSPFNRSGVLQPHPTTLASKYDFTDGMGFYEFWKNPHYRFDRPLVIFGIVDVYIPGKVYDLVEASMSAILFSVYLVYNTQMAFGGKQLATSPEEYVLAANSIYVDILNIYIYIVDLVRLSHI
ncbi:protein lifeguard 1-like [Daphnia pulicaria]|uniref:protein lifeguard 1-like n=1 Tax=Daphnia pulicaria TaxID=35523 RepID=UPI001EEC2064|nr:protein lifeguard 1-like [Daphnia pulicaria]